MPTVVKLSPSDAVDQLEQYSEKLLQKLMASDEAGPLCPFCNFPIDGDTTDMNEDETDDPFPHLYLRIHCLRCEVEYTLHLTPVNMMVHRAPNLENITI